MPHIRISAVVGLSMILGFQAPPTSAGGCLSQVGRFARGWCEAVAASGDELIFGDGSSVMIRHTDGSLTEIETNTMVVALEVVDDYVYAVGDRGLIVVDLLAPGGPVVIGRCAMPGVAESVEVLDGKAYVSGGEWGMRVVDVSVPSDPVQLGVIDTPGWAADAAAEILDGRPVAVIADSRSGLVLVDAADPSELETLAFVDIGDDGGGAVETLDGYAFALDPNGSLLTAVDISRLADPQTVDSLELENHGNQGAGLALLGGLAYVAGKHFFVVDVSYPPWLNQLASVDVFGTDVTAYHGQVSVAAGETIRFIDASDPRHPVEGEPLQVGIHPFQASGITATDRYVIGFSKEIPVNLGDGDPTPGIRVFDVDDPGRPAMIGECLRDHRIAHADAAGTLVYVVTYDGFFRVIELADASQPQEIGTAPLPASWSRDVRFIDLDVDGDLAVVVGADGLVAFDITDPANPIRSGQLIDGFSHVELVGDRAYVTVSDEIRLVDLTEPSAPVLVDDGLHQLEMPGYVSDFEVADGYAYLVGDLGDYPVLMVVDVGTVTGWVMVGLEPVPGKGSSSQDGAVSLSGKTLVLALPCSESGDRSRLMVFDVSETGEPSFLGETVMPGERPAVLVAGETIFTTEEWEGLGVYRLWGCSHTLQDPPEYPIEFDR